MQDRTSSPTSTKSAERGTGLLGAIVGVTIFLTTLAFGAGIAVNLYATSAVTGVAFDAASEVAGSDGGPDSIGRAEDRARSVLSRFESGGGTLDFEWETDPDEVRLTVTATRPGPFALLRLPFQEVHRTVHVRREASR
jgi:hypothetical protein